MRDRLITGVVAGLIAWGVSHSLWVALAAFGVVAGLSGDKRKWMDEIVRGIEDEIAKQTGKARKSDSQPTLSATAKADATDKAPAGTVTRGNAAMLKHKTNASGAARTDRISMKSINLPVVAAVVEQSRKEIPMFVKMIVAVILAAATGFMTQSPGPAIGVFLAAFFIALIIEGVRIVPQQNAWVVERLGKFHMSLQPGFNLIVPFIDRVAYRHSLKEVPLDIAEQVCITRDNTQLAVDGIIYFQVVDPRLASYGTSDYELAISQLAQTALRSVIGKMELDKTFESRDEINQKVVSVLDEAGRAWRLIA